MSKPIVAVTAPLSVDVTAYLSDIAEVRLLDPARRQDVLAGVAGASGILSMLSDAVNDELFDAAGAQLQVCANYAVGYNNMDLAAARARGIVCSNTPDVLTLATAELAWSLLFAAARRTVEGDAMMRRGEFHGWKATMLLGADITGRTLGIIGAGRIGQAMARMARGFEMQVFYYNRTPKPTFEAATGAKFVPLDELLVSSDFVSLHLPYTPDLHHLIGADAFAKMKPSAIFINTGRGACVDEDALVQALRNGQIAAAGLDVYEREPAMAKGLADLPNAVLLPHLGSATVNARTAMAKMACDNIRAVLTGQKAPQGLG